MEGPLGNARSGRLLLCRGPVSAAFRGVPAASRKPRPAGPARVPRASGPRPGRVPRPWRVSAASRGVLAASRRVPELASPASRPRLKDLALPRPPYMGPRCAKNRRPASARKTRGAAASKAHQGAISRRNPANHGVRTVANARPPKKRPRGPKMYRGKKFPPRTRPYRRKRLWEFFPGPFYPRGR
jgi:hypothetical protein